MLELFVFALCLALVAVTWSVVLVDSGMLLEPVVRSARHLYRVNTGSELDDQWWFKPLWGCYKCVSGEWAAWMYPFFYHPATWHVSLAEWLRFFGLWAVLVSAAILFACILNKAYQWSQQ